MRLTKMKKILFAITLSGFLVLLAGTGLGAENLVEPPTGITILGPNGVLAKVADTMFSAALVIAVIFFIIAGYLFITGQGEPEKIKNAQHTVIYVVVGLFIVFLAKGFVRLVGFIVTGSW